MGKPSPMGVVCLGAMGWWKGLSTRRSGSSAVPLGKQVSRWCNAASYYIRRLGNRLTRIRGGAPPSALPLLDTPMQEAPTPLQQLLQRRKVGDGPFSPVAMRAHPLHWNQEGG